jgi:hypothetical protein
MVEVDFLVIRDAAARARVDSIATDAAAAAAMKPRRLIVSFIDSPSTEAG